MTREGQEAAPVPLYLPICGRDRSMSREFFFARSGGCGIGGDGEGV